MIRYNEDKDESKTQNQDPLVYYTLVLRQRDRWKRNKSY